MNVQELINELMKVEDKSKKVIVWDKWGNEYTSYFELDETDSSVILGG